MAHNLYYWGLGVLQWTAWECVLMRLWATGKVPYAADAEVLARPGLLAWNVFWVMMVPIWRDLHFYIAHRFIHIRAIYRFVHSLHHRNADPEPFSGMTMHPVEQYASSNPQLAPFAHTPGHIVTACTTSPTRSSRASTCRASRRSPRASRRARYAASSRLAATRRGA